MRQNKKVTSTMFYLLQIPTMYLLGAVAGSTDEHKDGSNQCDGVVGWGVFCVPCVTLLVYHTVGFTAQQSIRCERVSVKASMVLLNRSTSECRCQ